MLFDRGIVAPGVDAGYVDSESAFGGKAFPGEIRQFNPGTQPFLKVNRNGERFANESCPYNDIVYAAAHQPGRVYAQISDANMLEDAKRFHTIGCSAGTRKNTMEGLEKTFASAEEKGCFFRADTIEELADKMGFTGDAKDTFLATVERYNELYDKQNDEDFGKPAYRLSAIRTAPFYGYWLGASLLTTEQGIAINEKGQALDTNNQPMAGLYITGDMSGSFFANNYPCLMAGVAMGRTLTFAMKPSSRWPVWNNRNFLRFLLHYYIAKRPRHVASTTRRGRFWRIIPRSGNGPRCRCVSPECPVRKPPAKGHCGE